MQPSPAVLIARAAAQIGAAGLPSGVADARILLAHALGVASAQLAVTRDVTPDQVARFDQLVARRVLGEPLQYLTGVAFFRHETLAVGPGVLCPRPETEGLVQLVIDWINQRRLVCPRVVDLGTGSGAIAAALARETKADVCAVEASPQAYRYALENLAGTKVRLQLGDWGDAFRQLDGQVDVVVANPPYVPAGTVLPPDVAGHEPAEALFGGDDGLDGLRGVLPVARRLLRPGGLLACEHDDLQGSSAPDLVRAAGFVEVSDHVDLAGRPRYLVAHRQGGDI